MSNELMTLDDVVAIIEETLEGLEKLDGGDPQIADDIKTGVVLITQGVRELLAANRHNEALLASTLTALDDAMRQRDRALDDRDWQRTRKRAEVVRDLARYIAYDAKITPGDVERVLEVLSGSKDLPISEYTKQDFFNAFGVMAEELFAEEQFQADAEAEYQAEIDQQGSYDDDNE